MRLSLLSTLLEHHGNNVVRRSGVARAYSKLATHRRWLTSEELDRLCASAQGVERLVLALEAKQGLRRVELTRLRLEDVDSPKGWLAVRGKAHKGDVSRRVPIGGALRSELAWWIPQRLSAAQGAEDCPEVLAWNEDGRMRPYSYGSIDRFVRAAGNRAGIVVSNHDLRRTFGRVLKNRGADWREIAGLYGHASIAQSEYYVGQEEDRLVETMRLLDRPVEEMP
ncbi:MAG TPA: site-specific integrase [Thermoplasmata archaeon]|nr:site-specific integrase [Thermoplasmata archaeon]